MSVHQLIQFYTEFAHGAANHPGGAPYVVAYLSSAAVEIVAIGGALALMGVAIARRASGWGMALGSLWSEIWREFDFVQLGKLVIPLACLTMTGWIWFSMHAS